MTPSVHTGIAPQPPDRSFASPMPLTATRSALSCWDGRRRGELGKRPHPGAGHRAWGDRRRGVRPGRPRRLRQHLFMHRLWKLRPGEELTLERVEMDAQICREYPCSTEFYKAKVELSRQRSQHSRL